MTNVQSKLLIPVKATCLTYAHPWTESCWHATAGLLLHASQHSLRIYTAVYLLSLMTRGRIPNARDMKRTLLGIVQSSAFLTTNAFSFIMFTCMLRNLLGSFHFITLAYIPAFLASLCAIFVERPTRRILLTLYVANTATETAWRMAESRGMVKSLPHGQAIIFGISASVLLYLYRLGLHHQYKDSLFNIFRFVVGSAEEGKRIEAEIEDPIQAPAIENLAGAEDRGNRQQQQQQQPRRRQNRYRDISFLVRIYLQLMDKIKSQSKHKSCPHNHSCLHYSISSGARLFIVGFGLQVTLKTLLQLKKIVQLKLSLKKVIFNRETLKLGMFLGGFSFLFRSISCSLRHIFGYDDPIFALPAGLIASCAFTKYPDVTVALYVMWKMLQICYTIGMDKGYLPTVPGFQTLLYCASTALLFHAAILEPKNLRPSYWKFLHGISGGRVCAMDRRPFEVWGLSSTEATKEIIKLTNTNTKVKFMIS